MLFKKNSYQTHQIIFSVNVDYSKLNLALEIVLISHTKKKPHKICIIRVISNPNLV